MPKDSPQPNNTNEQKLYNVCSKYRAALRAKSKIESSNQALPLIYPFSCRTSLAASQATKQRFSPSLSSGRQQQAIFPMSSFLSHGLTSCHHYQYHSLNMKSNDLNICAFCLDARYSLCPWLHQRTHPFAHSLRRYPFPASRCRWRVGGVDGLISSSAVGRRIDFASAMLSSFRRLVSTVLCWRYGIGGCQQQLQLQLQQG